MNWTENWIVHTGAGPQYLHLRNCCGHFRDGERRIPTRVATEAEHRLPLCTDCMRTIGWGHDVIVAKWAS